MKVIDIGDIGSREAAREELRTNGFVVVSNLTPDSTTSWKDCAQRVPLLLFDRDELLLGDRHDATAVHQEQDGFPDLRGQRLLPHTDGYIWGPCYPDIIVLLCEQADPDGGGENYLIDGEKVLHRLSPTVVKLLETEPVDHTERGTDSIAQGVECWNPVFQRRQEQLLWRRMVGAPYTLCETEGKTVTCDDYISLWEPREDAPPAVKEALRELDRAILQEDELAPRFVLKRGEALVIDNFRMLHARERYSVSSRRTWRVWSWTRKSNGLPLEVKGLDFVPATVKGAETVIAR